MHQVDFWASNLNYQKWKESTVIDLNETWLVPHSKISQTKYDFLAKKLKSQEFPDYST